MYDGYTSFSSIDRHFRGAFFYQHECYYTVELLLPSKTLFCTERFTLQIMYPFSLIGLHRILSNASWNWIRILLRFQYTALICIPNLLGLFTITIQPKNCSWIQPAFNKVQKTLQMVLALLNTADMELMTFCNFTKENIIIWQQPSKSYHCETDRLSKSY